ncbi:hypothetical protein [Acinetobacter baumannii]|uniref:hypothetical protein n=1 Tax=Acinetobacter baumannii TaxID=470 RepID=UPI003F1CC37F
MHQNRDEFYSRSLFFLILFFSFFSINSLPVNPVYIIGFPIVFLTFLFINFSKINKYQLYFYVYSFLASIGFIVGGLYFSKIDKDIIYLSSILYVYCIILGAQTIIVGSTLRKSTRIEIYNNIYYLLIFFMSLDLSVRVLLSQGTKSFYDFKWGLFYYDSNFSALIILLFIMYSIFLKVNSIYDIGKIRFIVLIFLLITTFSRAAIFAFIISYLLLRYARKILVCFSIIFSTIAIYVFYKMVAMYISGESFVNIDGSFNSKFYLISVAIDNYKYLATVNKIFGIGMANFTYFSEGIFAHNMLITLFYEFGLYGILLFVIFILLSYMKIGKDILYILIPFFIAGFSLFSAYMPFFFILLACMYLEKKQIGVS